MSDFVPQKKGTGSTAARLLPSAAVHYDDNWLGSALRPLLVLVLAACFITILGAVVRRYLPGLPPAVVLLNIVMAGVAALVAVISSTWLARPEQRLRRTAGYRLAEIAILLLIGRIALWLVEGKVPAPVEMLEMPQESLFSGSFGLTVILMVLAWLMASGLTEDLVQLALQPDELRLLDPAAGRFADSSRPAASDRTVLLRRFVGGWVGWGIVLLLLTSTLRIDGTALTFWNSAYLEVPPEAIIAVIVYFLTGLLLISMGNLALLRARWVIDRTPPREEVVQRWPLYVAASVGVIGVTALLLPLGNTFLIARAIEFVINAFFQFGLLLFQLIAGLLILLASLLPGGERMTEAPPPMPMGAPPPMDQAMISLPAWTNGVIFWLLMALIFGFAAAAYFGERQFGKDWLSRLLALLALRWRALRALFQRKTAGALSLPKWLAPGAGGQLRKRTGSSNTPGDRLVDLYFAMLSWARSRGVDRRDPETPNQFAPRLAEQVDETADETVETLTAAFVRLRYGGEEPDPATLETLRTQWEKLAEAEKPEQSPANSNDERAGEA
jgi:hypothetical protein